jgi:prepilin-type N-terminal cleavage/methylation domain-containing protein
MTVENEITRDQRGFTLIEVLVALAIFAIGIVACYTMQVRSSGTTIRANSVSTSANWATYRIEQLVAKGYSDKDWYNDDGDGSNDKPDGIADIDSTIKPDGQLRIQPDGNTGSTAGTNDLYSIYWNVANDSPVEGIKQIRMIVFKNRGLNKGMLYSHDYFKSNENM